jgi:hypothetical protein
MEDFSEEIIYGLINLRHGILEFEYEEEISNRFGNRLDLGGGLGLRKSGPFLFFELRLPNQIKGYDFLGFPVFEDLKVVDPQVVHEFLAVEHPDWDLDIDDLGCVLELLGIEGQDQEPTNG